MRRSALSRSIVPDKRQRMPKTVLQKKRPPRRAALFVYCFAAWTFTTYPWSVLLVLIGCGFHRALDRTHDFRRREIDSGIAQIVREVTCRERQSRYGSSILPITLNHLEFDAEIFHRFRERRARSYKFV